MAIIENSQLTITTAESAGNYKVTVECDIIYSELEFSQMKSSEKTPLFSLKCSVWGADPIADSNLLTYTDVKYYPAGSPTSNVHAVFETSVSRSTLDEDLGTDEVYAKLILDNLYVHGPVEKRTNTVKRNF
jgi:hypothetical protein